jgi:hypothetical protein
MEWKKTRVSNIHIRSNCRFHTKCHPNPCSYLADKTWDGRMEYGVNPNGAFLVSRIYIMNAQNVSVILPLALLQRVLTRCPLNMWYLNFHVRYGIKSKQMHRRIERWCLQLVRRKRSISALRRSVTQTTTWSSVSWILMPLLPLSQWESFSYQSTLGTSLSWTSNTLPWE